MNETCIISVLETTSECLNPILQALQSFISLTSVCSVCEGGGVVWAGEGKQYLSLWLTLPFFSSLSTSPSLCSLRLSGHRRASSTAHPHPSLTPLLNLILQPLPEGSEPQSPWQRLKCLHHSQLLHREGRGRGWQEDGGLVNFPRCFWSYLNAGVGTY